MSLGGSPWSPLVVAALSSGLLACSDDGDAAAGGGGATTTSGAGGGATVGATGASTSTAGVGTTTASASSTSGGSGGGVTATTGSGATTGAGGGGGGVPVSCDACGAATDEGVIANPQVDELSGLAASRVHPGVLYGNDDSGEAPVLFAFTLSGEDRGTYPLTGAAAVDWEDLAAGPCSDGSPGCLYVPDFGDNAEVRSDLVLYRVREPVALGGGLQPALAIEAIPFSYPDGPHNAEALVVHPTTGVVTIVTKGDAPAIFELTPPLVPGMVATRVAAFDNPSSIVTGADVDAAGATLAIRTYTGVFLYAVAEGASLSSALGGAPCQAPNGFEIQGEAIAWLPEGGAYVTASEGAGATLHRVGCP